MMLWLSLNHDNIRSENGPKLLTTPSLKLKNFFYSSFSNESKVNLLPSISRLVAHKGHLKLTSWPPIGVGKIVVPTIIALLLGKRSIWNEKKKSFKMAPTICLVNARLIPAMTSFQARPTKRVPFGCGRFFLVRKKTTKLHYLKKHIGIRDQL